MEPFVAILIAHGSHGLSQFEAEGRERGRGFW